jgi:hypothetical protein
MIWHCQTTDRGTKKYIGNDGMIDYIRAGKEFGFFDWKMELITSFTRLCDTGHIKTHTPGKDDGRKEVDRLH